METIKTITERTGSLSAPSKMPGFSYSIPAAACQTGQKLRRIDGSVCSKCYACKGRYVFPNVKDAMAKRLDAIAAPGWADDMAELIRRKEKSGFFRWHDSGDVQSTDHWAKIKEIARRLPDIRFWLPTKEAWVAKAAAEDCPDNLTVRLSAYMIGAHYEGTHGNTSSVNSGQGYKCPATYDKKSEGKCGDCRACWDRNVVNIDYMGH
jgi:hypothetical protein